MPQEDLLLARQSAGSQETLLTVAPGLAMKWRPFHWVGVSGEDGGGGDRRNKIRREYQALPSVLEGDERKCLSKEERRPCEKKTCAYVFMRLNKSQVSGDTDPITTLMPRSVVSLLDMSR